MYRNYKKKFAAIQDLGRFRVGAAKDSISSKSEEDPICEVIIRNTEFLVQYL
jgi:hypothetical protein